MRVTKEQYKEQMRTNRGRLKSVDAELEDIHYCGSDKLLEWSLHTKATGVTKIAYIATSIVISEQDDFVDWYYEQPRTATDIDIKLLELV